MSPLPSPEERRKQLKILGLEPMTRRTGISLPGNKSAAADERAEQRQEARRRSKQLPRPYP
ncbi:MAG TPA: hypothetical protein VIO35_04235 [Chloroflexota bacterium]